MAFESKEVTASTVFTFDLSHVHDEKSSDDNKSAFDLSALASALDADSNPRHTEPAPRVAWEDPISTIEVETTQPHRVTRSGPYQKVMMSRILKPGVSASTVRSYCRMYHLSTKGTTVDLINRLLAHTFGPFKLKSRWD